MRTFMSMNTHARNFTHSNKNKNLKSQIFYKLKNNDECKDKVYGDGLFLVSYENILLLLYILILI